MDNQADIEFIYVFWVCSKAIKSINERLNIGLVSALQVELTNVTILAQLLLERNYYDIVCVVRENT